MCLCKCGTLQTVIPRLAFLKPPVSNHDIRDTNRFNPSFFAKGGNLQFVNTLFLLFMNTYDYTTVNVHTLNRET